MQNDALTNARETVEKAMREHREIMDATQEMYHHLFIQSLTVQKHIRTAVAQLQDIEPPE